MCRNIDYSLHDGNSNGNHAKIIFYQSLYFHSNIIFGNYVTNIYSSCDGTYIRNFEKKNFFYKYIRRKFIYFDKWFNVIERRAPTRTVWTFFRESFYPRWGWNLPFANIEVNITAFCAVCNNQDKRVKIKDTTIKNMQCRQTCLQRLPLGRPKMVYKVWWPLFTSK